MKLIVLEVSPKVESKYSGFPTRRVTFEELDKPGVYHHLNLDEKFKQKVDNWEPFIEKGNILECSLQLNGKNVSIFEAPRLVKKASKE